MTDDERQKYLERYRNAPDKNLRRMLAYANPEQRDLLNAILDDHGRAADAPVQERSDRDYEQKERHHREVKRSAWIAAFVSLLGAAASWASVWFQAHHSEPTVTPASPAPAVATPSPTKAPTEGQ